MKKFFNVIVEFARGGLIDKLLLFQVFFVFTFYLTALYVEGVFDEPPPAEFVLGGIIGLFIGFMIIFLIRRVVSDIPETKCQVTYYDPLVEKEMTTDDPEEKHHEDLPQVVIGESDDRIMKFIAAGFFIICMIAILYELLLVDNSLGSILFMVPFLDVFILMFIIFIHNRSIHFHGDTIEICFLLGSRSIFRKVIKPEELQLIHFIRSTPPSREPVTIRTAKGKDYPVTYSKPVTNIFKIKIQLHPKIRKLSYDLEEFHFSKEQLLVIEQMINSIPAYREKTCDVTICRKQTSERKVREEK